MAKVSDKEIETTGKVISKSYERTYYRSIFDTQVGTGFAFSFTQLPQQAIKTVLGEAWSGAHFSRRVWHNTQMLAQEAEKVITSGIISGASVPRMAKQIEDVMQTGKYAATRLIRTEPIGRITRQSSIPTRRQKSKSMPISPRSTAAHALSAAGWTEKYFRSKKQKKDQLSTDAPE